MFTITLSKNSIIGSYSFSNEFHEIFLKCASSSKKKKRMFRIFLHKGLFNGIKEKTVDVENNNSKREFAFDDF